MRGNRVEQVLVDRISRRQERERFALLAAHKRAEQARLKPTLRLVIDGVAARLENPEPVLRTFCLVALEAYAACVGHDDAANYYGVLSRTGPREVRPESAITAAERVFKRRAG